MNKLMTHIVGGYPSLEKSEELVKAMDKNGVEFVEIQIPFSDPVADGATIMSANHQSLESGTTPRDCMRLMAGLKGKVEVPLLFMTYFNVVYKYGVEEFCRDAKEAGCYGLIVPDIPFDEEPFDHYIEKAKKYGLHAIQVVSPITPEDRLKKIAEVASGFVYCVSHAGTTGAKDEMAFDLKEYLGKVRECIDLPLAVGFGISSREQVEEALKSADIAVIGSKVINVFDEGGVDGVEEFLKGVV